MTDRCDCGRPARAESWAWVIRSAPQGIGRALEHVIALPVQADRLDEFGVVEAAGKVFLGVQAAAVAQGFDHVGGDRPLVEGLGAVADDGAEGFRQGRLFEEVAWFGGGGVGEEVGGAAPAEFFSTLRSQSQDTFGDTGQPSWA